MPIPIWPTVMPCMAVPVVEFQFLFLVTLTFFYINTGVCNKFIEIKFSVKYMIWPSTFPFQPNLRLCEYLTDKMKFASKCVTDNCPNLKTHIR